MLYVYIKQKHGRAKKKLTNIMTTKTHRNSNADDHDNNEDRKRKEHGENSGTECRTQSFFQLFSVYVL